MRAASLNAKKLKLDPWRLGNIREMSMLGGDRSYCLIFLQEKKNFGNNGKKICKTSYQSFLLFPSLA